MTFRLLAACLATAFIASPALAAPKTTTQYRLSIAEAAGTVDVGGVSYSFTAKSYIDVDGSRGGSIAVDSYDFTFGGSGVSFVQCSGPEFADMVSMNQSTGAVSVNATLDTTSASCFAFNYSGPVMTVRLSGAFTGAERTTQHGSVTQQLQGSTFKFNYQEDRFSESFSGSTGYTTGVFTGSAVAGRSTNRTKVK